MAIRNIYKTSSGGAVVALIVAAVIFVITITGDTSKVDTWIPWLYLAILILGAVDFKFGIYGKKQDGIFLERKHFFYDRRIPITDIDQILYQPTWRAGEKMRSIYFIDKKDKRIKIRMSNGAYAPSTLAQILADLTQENPSIRLDDAAEDLLRKYQVS